MKKLTTFLLAVVLSMGTLLAQPIQDKAIIPIGVTLNSVLRLNVTSGGNIEFIFNTIEDYEEGVNTARDQTRYRTIFNVAASANFDVLMYAETDFTNTDNYDGTSSGTMGIGYLEYEIDKTSAATGTVGTEWDFPSDAVLKMTLATAPTTIVADAGASAGSILQNEFQIDWSLGTNDATTSPLGYLIGLGFSGRYIANIVLEVQ